MPRLLLPAASTTCHLSLPLRLLLLSTLLSHLGLTTGPHSTLVSLLCSWDASSGLSALPRASWAAFLELDTYLPTCLMYSTGCPSSSGSCSVLVPCLGGVSWVLEVYPGS